MHKNRPGAKQPSPLRCTLGKLNLLKAAREKLCCQNPQKCKNGEYFCSVLMPRRGGRKTPISAFYIYIGGLTDFFCCGIIFTSNERRTDFGVCGVAADRQRRDPLGEESIGSARSALTLCGERAFKTRIQSADRARHFCAAA